jgi:hypothetical protein
MTDPIYRRTLWKACIRCGRRFEVLAYARKSSSRCPEHRSGWDAKPKERDLAYVDPRYKRNRKIVLEQEPTCHWRLPGCTIKSTTADHVVAVSRGGTNDLDNLVGSCLRCNMARGRDLGNQTKRKRRE